MAAMQRLDAGKMLLPTHDQLVGRGLHHCWPVVTLSGLKTRWWKGEQNTHEKKCYSVTSICFHVNSICFHVYPVPLFMDKFGQICGHITILPIIFTPYLQNDILGVGTFEKCISVCLSPIFYWCLVTWNIIPGLLMHVGWLHKYTDGVLITQMNLACGFAPLYVRKCVCSHVRSDVRW